MSFRKYITGKKATANSSAQNLGRHFQRIGKTSEQLKAKYFSASKTLSKLGAVLARCNCLALASACCKNAITINPNCKDAYLQLARILVSQDRNHDAAETYKKVIALQPTLSTVYNLGLETARNGNLNDKFYSAALNLVGIDEISLMIKTLAKSPIIYQPSKLWLYFMIFNTYQLETGGVENFKRTVNNNYFNWTADNDVNTQFQALKHELCWSNSDLINAQSYVNFDSSARPREFSEEKWTKYLQFLSMLWEVTIRNDQLKLLDKLDEPPIGNPVAVEYKNRIVTQDICNSVLEVNTIMNFIKHDSDKKLRVIELGAGHGRVSNVLLHAVENIQIVIVDIPPALYVSQWYLTKLFPKLRVFKFRDFSSYREVQEEFEECSLAFLSPAQVEYLPDQMFDLFINISSLHEMTPAQIENWFGQINRLCKGWFYTKQYIESKNSFDDIVIRQEDYPVRKHWKPLLNRKSPIFPELFEAIYQIHSNQSAVVEKKQVTIEGPSEYSLLLEPKNVCKH